MDNLIRNLEEASEGSRELDGRIALSLGWVKHHAGWAHWTTPEGLENQHVPFFSDSFDDALTLVLKGRGLTIRTGTALPQVIVHCPPGTKFKNHYGKAATLALALCIAALKARDFKP